MVVCVVVQLLAASDPIYVFRELESFWIKILISPLTSYVIPEVVLDNLCSK